jgi:hypothetical protein
MQRLFFLACASAAMLSLETKAADIALLDGEAGVQGIAINGTIMPGDRHKFANIALTTDEAVVLLHSDGGNILEAFEIGRAIRLKKFPTFVTPNEVCASACALIWLAGTPRLMSPSAKIGFHAAYISGSNEISSSGNTIVGSYLNSLGFTDTAIFNGVSYP